jgi:hypothetical protein
MTEINSIIYDDNVTIDVIAAISDNLIAIRSDFSLDIIDL